jgi:uncharacterized membrane protein YqaE (UPF0057 family)
MNFTIWIRYSNNTHQINTLNRQSTINDLYNTINLYLNENISDKLEDFILLYTGKCLTKNNTLTLVDYNIVDGATIDVNLPIKGGNPFEGVISALKEIAKLFRMLEAIFIFTVSLTIWLIQFFLWFLIDFCNPLNLAADFIGGIAKLTKLFFAVTTDAIAGVFKYVFNYLLTPIFSGFWGWDSITTTQEKINLLKEQMADSKTKGQPKCNDKGIKVYDTPNDQISFTVILSTILLPPMGVFMEFGLTSWINIVICGILTLAYYFPGLIYALVLIYSQ